MQAGKFPSPVTLTTSTTKVLDLKSTIKFKMKKVVILFSSEGC